MSEQEEKAIEKTKKLICKKCKSDNIQIYSWGITPMVLGICGTCLYAKKITEKTV
jgi:late competence protein required for DNA uptake (superfamily II DNA/RNA helicase)